jgi:hypothetical protein
VVARPALWGVSQLTFVFQVGGNEHVVPCIACGVYGREWNAAVVDFKIWLVL